ncbi:MAG: EndoU domain-containing protein [Marinibacterium sp.]
MSAIAAHRAAAAGGSCRSGGRDRGARASPDEAEHTRVLDYLATGNILSTPIPDGAGPNIVNMENPHSIESISIPEDRARHILHGEGRGGGHRYGTGIPGKTEFPANWSDDDILEAIRQVAGTGTVDRPAHRDGDLVIVGEVNGVTIEVVVQPNGEVRTGYPLSGPGVRRN